jgi:hypothetical protein
LVLTIYQVPDEANHIPTRIADPRRHLPRICAKRLQAVFFAEGVYGHDARLTRARAL